MAESKANGLELGETTRPSSRVAASIDNTSETNAVPTGTRATQRRAASSSAATWRREWTECGSRAQEALRKTQQLLGGGVEETKGCVELGQDAVTPQRLVDALPHLNEFGRCWELAFRAACRLLQQEGAKVVIQDPPEGSCSLARLVAVGIDGARCIDAAHYRLSVHGATLAGFVDTLRRRMRETLSLLPDGAELLGASFAVELRRFKRLLRHEAINDREFTMPPSPFAVGDEVDAQDGGLFDHQGNRQRRLDMSDMENGVKSDLNGEEEPATVASTNEEPSVTAPSPVKSAGNVVAVQGDELHLDSSHLLDNLSPAPQQMDSLHEPPSLINIINRLPNERTPSPGHQAQDWTPQGSRKPSEPVVASCDLNPGAGSETEGAEDIPLDMEVSESKLRELLQGRDLHDVLSRAQPQTRRAAGAAKPSIRELPKTPVAQWPYQNIAEAADLVKLRSHFVAGFQFEFMKKLMRASPNENHSFEWVVAVDSSGSMVVLRDELTITMVLLIETLRRLECRWAVGKFSDEAEMLKEFDDPFSIQRGQVILESMRKGRGTKPISGLEGILKHVYGTPTDADGVDESKESEGSRTNHRIVLLISDGFSVETMQNDSSVSLKCVVDKYQCQLAVLRLHTSSKGHSESITKTLERACGNGRRLRSVEVDPTGSDTPMAMGAPGRTLELVRDSYGSVLAAIAEHTSRGEDGSPTINPADGYTVAVPQHRKPMHVWQASRASDALALQLSKETVEGKMESLYSVSPPLLAPPMAEHAEVDEFMSPGGVCERLKSVHAIPEAYPRYIHFLRQNCRDSATAVRKQWSAGLAKMETHITALTEVLESYVLPFNKFTQRRAALRGSQLYLPGLIKAVSTDFQYRRFFAAKTAGGQRSYSVSLMVDISASMRGHKLDCAVASLMMLCTALQRAGVDTFSIILFGEKVLCVKTEDQELNDEAMLAVMGNLVSSNITGTADAAAIECAIDLSQQSNVRGPKLAFVLTDGYTTCGTSLTRALLRANMEDVTVVGLGIGLDTPFVPQVYQRWAVAALPTSLPDALRELFSQDESAVSLKAPEVRSLGWGAAVELWNDSAKTAKEAAADTTSVFAELLKDVNTNPHGTLVRNRAPNSMDIDLCFVVDTTASMEPFLCTVMDQLRRLVLPGHGNSIWEKLDKKYPSLNVVLRFGLVAYNDEQAPRMVRFPDFPTMVDIVASTKPRREKVKLKRERMKAFMNSCAANLMSQAKMLLNGVGGHDVPEDVMDALVTTASDEMNWGSRVRFAFLVCDAPAHGHFFQNPPDHSDRRPNEGQAELQRAVMALKKKDVSMIMCHIHRSATQRMEQRLRTEFDTDRTQGTAPDRYGGKMAMPPGVDLFNKHINIPARHFIIILDSSGSMCGTPWNEAVASTSNFLATRRSLHQGQSKDVYSLLQFSSAASCMCRYVPITSTPPAYSQSGGGTVYTAGINLASSIISGAPAHITGFTPVIIFMSDGAPCDGPQSITAMTQLAQRTPKPEIHTVGFNVGRGSSADSHLINLCKTGMSAEELTKCGTGRPPRAHLAGMGQLTSVFNTIANNTASADTLMHAFAQKLSDHMCDKLMVDLL